MSGRKTRRATSSASEALLARALDHHQANRLEEAETLYRELLRRQPRHARVLAYFGHLCAACGRLDEAIDLYRRAVATDRQLADVHYNLGIALADQGRTEQAISSYRRALASRPDFVEALNNLGEALISLRRMADAEHPLRRAIELRPSYALAHYNLANALRQLGDRQGAAGSYRRAVALRPDHAGALNNLAVLLRQSGKPGEAAELLLRALSVESDNFETMTNLGNCLTDLGRSTEAMGQYRAALSRRQNHLPAISNLLMALNYDPALDSSTVAAEHRRLGAVIETAAGTPRRLRSVNRDPDRRLRIGYVSPDFRVHSCAFFLAPLFEAHDREQFEILCYSDVAQRDATTDRLRSMADRWREISGEADAAVADRIEADGIDILIDLAGHTSDNRLALFALKPAPLQASWLGYPNTTGMRRIDYRLTDAEADPPGRADSHYTETLWRLPRGFLCYEPPIEAPSISPIRGDAPVFGSFNNTSKLNPPVLRLWSAILRAVPGSRLLLKAKQLADPAARDRLAKDLMSAGLDPGRVTMSGWAATAAQGLEAYRHTHVALDPFPYNGTTTTCEALWMGVPVITLAGDRHSGRVGLTLLRMIDLADCIASSPEDYIAKAAALARDRDRLAGLRMGLASRMAASPLCDRTGFAKAVETAYRAMWRRWCSAAPMPA